MNDILFGNNNQTVIKHLAKKSYRSNKRRNMIVIVALALTAFMITSVFSLGCSYFEISKCSKPVLWEQQQM